MVCLPSCNIDRPIYIWRIESQLWQFYKRYPHLSPHLQIRPCLIHPYLPQPHSWAIKKGSLCNNLAWWPLPPARAVHPHASAHSDHQSPPRSTPPRLISHLSFFSMTFSRYQFFDKILEISLVFTHGITPAWVNHNRYFVRKCILMFCAMHEHLSCNYITQITSRKWHFFTQPH